MNAELEAVIKRINAIGARYVVHDEEGEYVTEDTGDSVVVLYEADGWVFFLHRPIGWTNGEQYEHVVQAKADQVEGALEPLSLKLVRNDGWTITFSSLSEEQKQDWIRWREYKKKQDWYERADAETIAKWTESVKEWSQDDAVSD